MKRNPHSLFMSALLFVVVLLCGCVTNYQLDPPKNKPYGYVEIVLEDKTRVPAADPHITLFISETVNKTQKNYGPVGPGSLYKYTKMRRIPLEVGLHRLNLKITTFRSSDKKIIPIDVDVVADKITLVTVFTELESRGFSYPVESRNYSIICKLIGLTEFPKHIWTWDPNKLTPTTVDIEFPLNDAFSGKGIYEIEFNYTSGAKALQIEWTALTADGIELVRDTHLGETGNRQWNNSYKLKVDRLVDGAKYGIKARIKGNGGQDSYGMVTVRKITNMLSQQNMEFINKAQEISESIMKGTSVQESVISDKNGNPMFKFVDKNGDGKAEEKYIYDVNQKKWEPVN